jgi:hypothetical protein
VKKVLPFVLTLIFCAFPCGLRAQLQVVTNVESPRVFSGEAKTIPIVFHNAGEQNFKGEIRARIYQSSFATAVLLSDAAWKQLEIPAGETVLESAALDFPAVKARTKFLVQWLEGTNRVIGVTSVLVYPTNLLLEFKSLAGGDPLGIFDPQNQIKPLLKSLRIHFENLEDFDLTNFSGKLAIIGSLASGSQPPANLRESMETLAKKNTAIVWIQPPGEESDKLLPSFYSVQKNQTAVIIAQPDLISDLSVNPQSQINLIYFCKLALHSQPLILPDLSSEKFQRINDY